MEAIVAPKR